MTKRESKNQFSFELDERNTSEVSGQITDAFNIGSTEQEEIVEKRDDLHMKEIKK